MTALFKTLFLALNEDGSRVWATQLAISAKHQSKSDRVEYHHIFPKAFMKTARPDLGWREIEAFVKQRRRMIAERLNRFLGV